MRYFTYIIYSESFNRYYIGSSADLVNRLARHNAGATQSTKPFKPWIFVYQEEFQTRTEARKRENQIKKYKGGRGFKKLLGE